MSAGKATANGAAHDAGVITIDNTPEALRDALEAAQKAAARRFFPDQVARMQAKVAKEEEALAGAKEALAAAEAELAAMEAQWAKEMN